MGDEPRGDRLVHLNVGFSTESELNAFLDFLYAKSGQSISFTGLLEAMCHEVTIVTAVHNIKSNKGSKTAGVDEMKMDSYLQMPKQGTDCADTVEIQQVSSQTRAACVYPEKQRQAKTAGYPVRY